jgi:serine/threonine-protein kinase
MHADRNLLFGILALQMDFISRDALIAAMSAWAVAKEKPLGQILVEQGALRPENRALLEPLVEANLKAHGGDPQQSLAALSSVGDVRKDLQAIADTDVQASLVHLPPTLQTDADPHATRAPDALPSPTMLRFRVLRPHAKGGLGEVFVAQDEELHRQVALKEIQSRHADDPNSRARFVLEAEITGGLEHPGIVPVYGLGHYLDGRPFYAMRFIRGDSLHEALDRFHKADVPGRDPRERNLAFRELLGRFVDVCQAVAYAHARGVLHRDLKPGNVMLGRYGETLVVDWGLAKPLGRAEPDTPEGPLTPASGSGSAPTEMGTAVGTPGYMSPEQAAGRLDLLGPQSDVYSLGATLYHLLTGRAPFEDKDLGAVLRQVQAGDYRPPRQVKPQVPAALEAVCRKAMRLRPEERYATPAALAQDVERWLADEAVGAYRESWSARLSRWGRRHRSLASGGAALLLSTVVGLGLGLWAVQAEQARTAQQRDQAQANLALAQRAVDECFLTAKDHPLLQRANLRQVRLLLLEKALPFYEGFQAQRPDDPALQPELAANYFRVGYILAELGRQPEAQVAYEKAAVLYAQLSAAHPDVPAHQDGLANTYNNLGNLQSATRQPAAARKAYERARDLGEQLSAAHPQVLDYQNNLASTYNNLGILQRATGQPAAARKAFERARKVWEQLRAAHPDVPDYQDGLAATYTNLGILQRDTGQLAAARKSFEQAREVFEQLSAAHPEVPDYQNGLAGTYNNLGVLQRDTGQPAAAQKAYERARDLREQLCAAHPEVPAYQNELASTYGNLGVLQHETGRPQDALAWYAKAFALLQAVRQREPHNPTARECLRNSHWGRARSLTALGRYREALADWDRALELDDGPNRLAIRLGRALALAHAGQHDRAMAEVQDLAPGKALTPTDLYNLACAAALAADSARQDGRLSPPTREKLAEQNALRAVELLKQAHAAGFFKDPANAELLQTDKDLDPLRARADFQQLATAVGKTTQK